MNVVIVVLVYLALFALIAPEIAVFFLIPVVIYIALLPTILAFSRNHPNRAAITLVNILGGAIGGIGWIIALVWVFTASNKEPVSAADEIAKLHKLKEIGVITPKEFEAKKSELLSD